MDRKRQTPGRKWLPFRIVTIVASLALVLGVAVVAMASGGESSDDPSPASTDSPTAAFEDLLDDLDGQCDKVDDADNLDCAGQAADDDGEDRDDDSDRSDISGPASVDDDDEGDDEDDADEDESDDQDEDEQDDDSDDDEDTEHQDEHDGGDEDDDVGGEDD